jgi:MFS family permease
MPTERRVLLWMCVLVAVNQLGFGGIMPVLALYAQSFGVSATAIGLAVAIYGLARFVVAAPSGRLADWLGRRPTLAIGGAVTAIGSLWCGLASSYPEFIVARFVAGAGAGLILTTGQVVLADITTPERRGRVIAIYQGTFIFAVGIGPYPGGLIAEHFGLAAPFLTYAAMAVGATALAWFAVSETRELARARRPHGSGHQLAYVMQLRLLMRNTGYVMVCIVALMNAVARTGGQFAIIPIIAKARLGLSVDQIGFGLALGTVIGLLAAYPSGVLVDHFGRKAVIVPTTVLSGVSILLFCIAPDVLWFIVACIVWGLASSIGSAAPASYAADSAPPGMNATTMSTFRMIGDAGYVIGPLALGLIADVYSADAALVIAAALLVIVGALFLRAPETYSGRRQA